MDPSLLSTASIISASASTTPRMASASSSALNAGGANANVFRTQYGTLTRADPAGLAELAGMTTDGGPSNATHAKTVDDDDDADLGIFETGSGDEDGDDSDEEGGGKKRRGKRAKAGNGGASGSQGDGKGEADSTTGRRKIRIEFIEDDSRRHITFSKRKAGIMKKAYELATLTGTQILLLVVSQTGLVYTFTTPKLAPVVKETTGKDLIRRCLESDDYGADGLAGDVPAERKKGGEQMPREPSASGKRKRSTASSTSRRNAAAAASAAVGESMSRQGSGSSSSDQYSHDSHVGEYARSALSSHHMLHQAGNGGMGMMSGGPHSSPLVGGYGLPGLPYYSPTTTSYDFSTNTQAINNAHQTHLSPHASMQYDAAQHSLGLNLGNQWSVAAGGMSATDLHRQSHLSPHGYTTGLPKTDAGPQNWTRG
ncbi:mads-box transcription factor-like protein [Ceraceosorus bombacis]|uniref:Mads-box transcription factor-like protein n=1 Tax=Ceraceosorus bombacis TaxID=401625 RepID=A0A0N7LAK0_9BASI|nr:mads-box transcription factor-like protein [Ceraceosorus bombacis]